MLPEAGMVLSGEFVKYFNNKENKHRFTNRAVQSMVKLFSIDNY